MRAQVQLSDRGNEFGGGLAFHLPKHDAEDPELVRAGPGHRQLRGERRLTILPSGTDFDKTAATSIGPVSSNVWVDVELVAVGDELSASLARTANPPRPILRWREPVMNTGRFGLYALTGLFSGEQLIQFRNLTVGPRRICPTPGRARSSSTSKSSSVPAGIRRIPTGTPNVVMTNCVHLPRRGRLPGRRRLHAEAGSYCLEVNQIGFNNSSAAAFDQPLGLNPDLPWRLSFKVRPGGRPAATRRILRSRFGQRLDSQRRAGGGWGSCPRSASRRTPASGPTPGTASTTASRRTATRSGSTATPSRCRCSSRPTGGTRTWAPSSSAARRRQRRQHPRYWTDVEIAQPP